jgi:hypothetical protein
VQGASHPPQFKTSLCVFTHAVPHTVRPAAQPQLPTPSHARVPGQVPHEPPHPSGPQALPPQPGLQQTPWLHTWPALQQALPHASTVHTHCDAWQVESAGQAWSQVPQCAGSVARSAHAPPQFCVPVGQSSTHDPVEHTSVAPHGWSQVPQWATSFCRLTHAVPHAVRPPVHPHCPLPSQVRLPAQVPHEPPHPSEPQTLPPQLAAQQALW